MKKYVLIILILLNFSCNARNNDSYLNRKITLAEPLNIVSMITYKSNFVCFDQFKKRILILSSDGKVLSEYSRTGKGPGEFCAPYNITLIKVEDNYLYALDGVLNKVIVLKINKDYSMTFYDDLVYNIGKIIDVDVDEERNVYLSIIGGKYHINIFDSKGTLAGQYLQVDDVKDYKDYINGIFYDSGKMLLAGYLTCQIKLYDLSQDHMKHVKNIDLAIDSAVERTENKSDGSVAIFADGISYVKLSHDKLFITINDAKKQKQVALKYDLDGNLIDTYEIKDSNTIRVLAISDKNELLYYQDENNDNEITVVKIYQ